jgi:anti-sigma-K factor RskA
MTPIDPAGDWLAAEQALGLLEGADLGEAQRRARSDPAFAAEVARWSERLGPLLDEVDEAAPPAGVWERIAAALGTPATAAANDNAAALHQRLTFWRNWSAGATAVAAALGLFLLVDPRAAPPPAPAPGPVQPVAEAPMIAAMAAKDSSARLVATWEPNARSLTVASAGELPTATNHDHELWYIVAGEKPKSLGVMPLNGRMHAQLAAKIAAALQQGTVLAISVEPAGGSPTGQPTGPVIASGALLPT